MYSKTSIYLAEMQMQSEFALKARDEMKLAMDSKLIKETFYHLHHFIIHSVNVEKILQDESRAWR